MARKIGSILGTFEEIVSKYVHRNRHFLRIKVMVDLKQPLKRGTMVQYKGKGYQPFFNYERLPTFCFVCGRLGHQLKDHESFGDLIKECYEEVDEQELSYGLWKRACPLPKAFYGQRTKESSCGTCSRSIFNVSSSKNRCGIKNKD